MKLLAGSYERFLFGYSLNLSDTTSEPLPLLFNYPAHLGPVKSLAASGNVAVTGGSDDVIKIFDLKGKADMGTLMKHEGAVTCLKFHGPHGKPTHLVSGSEDAKICVWDTENWQHLITLKGHKGPVNDVSIHPSGRLALSVSRDKGFRMWSLVKGKSALSIQLQREAELVSLSPVEGSEYALSLQGGLVKLHDSETGTEKDELPHGGRILTFTYHNENTILTAGEEGIIRVWDLRTYKESISIENAHSSRIRGLVTIPEKGDHPIPTNIASASSDGCLKVWDLRKVSESDKETKSHEPILETKSNARWTCLAVGGFSTKKGWKEPKKRLSEGESEEVQEKENESTEKVVQKKLKKKT